ncbi:immediate early response 3-interacting protein [Seminavis robusta]|uniref:Immediate early response 3-interacting protein n=1 Tax=Seminavis robusta TaxID=568900 RepID=A0A9N8EHA9_9STRA|nr:immediate early response 3-interacting protein [Seminavis robusta]|eukprot:Sro1190_g250860.1 immediate early response 3-interacting protein (83) ;mRNA; r:32167-32600
MGFSLWHLFKAGLLMCNAFLILNRRRFLAKYGLDDMNSQHANASNNPLIQQAAGLLHAVQYLRVPVIVANILTIVFEVLIGG